MKKLFLGALLAFSAAPAVAQLPDADPALWVVRDQDTTVYLFGTFHMLDGKSDWFNDEIKTAFDASQELVLEARMPEKPDDLKPLVAKYAVDPDGRTLSSRLPAKLKTQYERAIRESGLPAKAYDRFEPWFASIIVSQIATKKLGLAGEHGPEALLARTAAAKGVPIGELEGMESQLSMFDRMPEAQQISFLRQAVESVDTIDKRMAPMLAAWSSGDTDGLVNVMNKTLEDDPALYEMMFSSRNRAWAEWVANRLSTPGTVFLAVGAGHLAGRNSVQQLLAERGIASERVKP